METGETEEICSLLPQNYQAYTSLLHQEDCADLKTYTHTIIVHAVYLCIYIYTCICTSIWHIRLALLINPFYTSTTYSLMHGLHTAYTCENIVHTCTLQAFMSIIVFIMIFITS